MSAPVADVVVVACLEEAAAAEATPRVVLEAMKEEVPTPGSWLSLESSCCDPSFLQDMLVKRVADFLLRPSPPASSSLASEEEQDCVRALWKRRRCSRRRMTATPAALVGKASTGSTSSAAPAAGLDPAAATEEPEGTLPDAVPSSASSCI